MRTIEERAQLVQAYENRTGSGQEFLKQHKLSFGVMSLWRNHPKVRAFLKIGGGSAAAPSGVANGGSAAAPSGGSANGEPDWRALVTEYEAGDLTLKPFCRERGIKESAFRYYRSKFKTTDRRPEAARTQKSGGSAASGKLTCPRCGCDIVAETEQLLLKLKALEQLQ